MQFEGRLLRDRGGLFFLRAGLLYCCMTPEFKDPFESHVWRSRLIRPVDHLPAILQHLPSWISRRAVLIERDRLAKYLFASLAVIHWPAPPFSFALTCSIRACKLL